MICYGKLQQIAKVDKITEKHLVMRSSVSCVFLYQTSAFCVVVDHAKCVIGLLLLDDTASVATIVRVHVGIITGTARSPFDETGTFLLQGRDRGCPEQSHGAIEFHL